MAQKTTIVIEVRGGVVQNIQGLTDNVRVEVHDYDCDCDDEYQGIHKDTNGDEYFLGSWERGDRAMAQNDVQDKFLSAYIECALWFSVDDDGEPLDKNYSRRDLTANALQVVTEDCHVFQRINRVLLLHPVYNLDESQCGHDFWLTRNQHGAGFWDRDLGKLGDTLTKAAHLFGACNLCVTPGGQVDIF